MVFLTKHCQFFSNVINVLKISKLLIINTFCLLHNVIIEIDNIKCIGLLVNDILTIDK